MNKSICEMKWPAVVVVLWLIMVWTFLDANRHAYNRGYRDGMSCPARAIYLDEERAAVMRGNKTKGENQ